MDPVEVAAVVFGIVSVYLSVRENVLSWPTAIVNVALYTLVFFRAKLYADIAHPINSDCREMIQERVIQEYFNEIELSKQPGYVSRYDDFEFEYAEAPRPKPARFDPPHGPSGPASARLPQGANTSRPSDRAIRSRGDQSVPSRSDSQPPTPKPTPPGTGKNEGFGAGIFPDA